MINISSQMISTWTEKEWQTWPSRWHFNFSDWILLKAIFWVSLPLDPRSVRTEIIVQDLERNEFNLQGTRSKSSSLWIQVKTFIFFSHKHSTIIVKTLMKRDRFRMKNETNNNTKEWRETKQYTNEVKVSMLKPIN